MDIVGASIVVIVVVVNVFSFVIVVIIVSVIGFADMHKDKLIGALLELISDG